MKRERRSAGSEKISRPGIEEREKKGDKRGG